jgi:hypothetical protein
MKFAMFTHNDDAKCFHMVVQRTHKLVMMDRINFEDHALIKRWQVDKNECDVRDVQGHEKTG